MQAIKDLTDGMEFDSQFLVVAATKGVANQGRTYLNLTLQDSTGTMEAKKWDLEEGDETTFQAGNVVSLRGAVLDYRGHLQIKVYDAEPLSLDQIDVTRFVPSAPVPEKPPLCGRSSDCRNRCRAASVSETGCGKAESVTCPSKPMCRRISLPRSGKLCCPDARPG